MEVNIRLLPKWGGLALIISIGLLVQTASAALPSAPDRQAASAQQATGGLTTSAPTAASVEPSYSERLAAWTAQGVGSARSALPVGIGKPSRISDPTQLKLGEYAGRKDVLIWNSARKEEAAYEVDIPENALYEIHVTYRTLDDHGGTAPILWDVSLDGSRPFAEASSVALYRTWQDTRPIVTNNDGDQIRPRSNETGEWYTKPLVDSTGAHVLPLQWYLSKGKHTLVFSGYDGIAVSGIVLTPPEQQPPAYRDAARGQGQSQPVQAPVQTLQAEDFLHKNDTSIKLFSDRNPRSVPRAKGRITYNTVGGARWAEQNQEITWSFEVSESGRYSLGFRALQNVLAQKTSFRTVRIDGEIPFREFLAYGFPYSARWKGRVLADNAIGKPYEIYLEKGRHTVSLAVTHEPVAPIIATIRTLSQELDRIDWELRGLVGAVIDRNRTWDMARDYPGMSDRLTDLAARLEQLADRAVAVNGGKDSVSQGLVTAGQDLRSIARKTEEIPYHAAEIAAIRERLSLFIESLLKQPLQLDELYIAPAGGSFPRMEASLWSRIWGGLANFVYSFDSRDSITELSDDKLNIWVQRGRDYVDQLQQLADEAFTPVTGIPVKVNLLANPELLLMSNAAGVQPDIALGLTQDLPVDLAIRGSVHNLAAFADFRELYDKFSPGSWLPLHYDGGYYGLPETQSFQVLFYRKDILERLKLRVPQTWDDVYDILPTLQQNSMNFYVNPLQFSQYFYQNHIDFYDKDGLHTELDQPAAFRAFKQWTDLFNTYAIEREVPSFYQHFRDGTMPIGISDYNMYMQLSAAAPELNDRWKIALMPGTKQTDGTISRWAGGGQRTGVIFERSNKKEQAWTFLKWWLSADVQQQYGADLEAVNGIAFRWNTSNVEAFLRLPWRKEDAAVILEQWRWYKDIPNVPGGYFLEREVSNAWIRTVVSKVNYRSSLEQAVRDIDRELRRKQEEFGFVDAAGNRLKSLNIPVVNEPWEGMDRYVD
ncbi:extracellular solute-binding protein [Paenibacillus koleovorans]|uniref:extracellular solute-binding protein n=1 Tax=Paenibacillus koleovorans TaxID=121608 RepID=UPI0013E2AB45|nr:extracellular solute-binding protein [Paenibacillus koleovorans]